MLRRSTQPGVAHLVGVYPTTTETFIAQIIQRHQAFRPVMVIDEYRRDLQEPLPLLVPMFRKEQIWSRGTSAWILGQIDKKVLRRPPYTSTLRVVFARHRVVLLHAHFGYQGINSLPLMRSFGLPMITVFYGNDVAQIDQSAEMEQAYQDLFQEGALFLAEGPHLRNSLIIRGCPAEKVAVQRIAIDISQLAYHARRWSVGEPLRLLFCGRFVEKKGLQYAIEALALMAAGYPDCELRIIGDGLLREEMKALGRRLGVEKHLSFLGYQPYARYLEEIDAAHILVVPSVTASDGDTEGGAPTVLLEAQASGLPIVTTTHADIPNVVAPGESALIAQERSADGLAQALGELLSHPERWESMGQAGRAFVEEFHNTDKEVVSLEDHYRAVLGTM